MPKLNIQVTASSGNAAFDLDNASLAPVVTGTTQATLTWPAQGGTFYIDVTASGGTPATYMLSLTAG
jgi:hypothetical protein